MTAIHNETDFKRAIDGLSLAQQRQVGALLVERVLQFYNDERIQRAVRLAKTPDISDEELQDAYRAAKSASVESFARCGADGNWRDQAGHFVANAALACVSSGGAAKKNLAWEAATSSRMACTCENIAAGNSDGGTEQAHQYQILSQFLAG
jgi:hypothetical protein